MKLISFTAAILCVLVCNISFSQTTNANQCIAVEAIERPTSGWRVVAKNIVSIGEELFVVVEAHNPLNKPNSIDAKFVFSLEARTGRSELMSAEFYNSKNTVIFRRMFTMVKDNGKAFSILTKCFSRDVKNVIQMNPIMIEVKTPKKDNK